MNITKSMVNKYGPKRINPGTGRLNQFGASKGSKTAPLPSRHALNVLTKGDPAQRSINNYAKLTPTGASAPMSYADIMNMGLNGVNAGSDDQLPES